MARPGPSPSRAEQRFISSRRCFDGDGGYAISRSFADEIERWHSTQRARRNASRERIRHTRAMTKIASPAALDKGVLQSDALKIRSDIRVDQSQYVTDLCSAARDRVHCKGPCFVSGRKHLRFGRTRKNRLAEFKKQNAPIVAESHRPAVKKQRTLTYASADLHGGDTFGGRTTLGHRGFIHRHRK